MSICLAYIMATGDNINDNQLVGQLCQDPECILARKHMLTHLEKELESLKLKNATLAEEMKLLRQNSVSIQQAAEQEEEFIANTLLKRIQRLKQEKESLALEYEEEEEFLTNDLSKKLMKVRAEKAELEKAFEVESEALCNKLNAKINQLEANLKK